MRIPLLLAVSMLSFVAYGQEEKPVDLEGSHDHPAVKRWPNSVIVAATYREFESFKFPTKDGASTVVEGKYTYLQYHLPAGVSCTQLTRNYENALKAQNLTLHSGTEAPTEEVGWATGKWVSGEGKAKAGGGQIFIVSGCPSDDTDGPLQHLWVVEKQQMEQKIEVDADAMADEISKNGHIALYGITFATGKADISPESGKTLEQIAALLTKKPDWKLRIEGHTDNVGAAKANLDLSKKRSESVKAWLTGKLSVAPARLVTEGLGDKKPVAPNTDDAGRAKNRRVELYKL